MIIITGASSGIGQFLFQKYQQQGESVLGVYNSNFVENLHQVDITNEESISNFFSKNAHSLEKITLINSAGINYNNIIKKFDVDKFKKVIDVNLIGSFLMIKHCLKFMQDQNWGRIINISSVVPQIGVAGTGAYSASKSALWGLTKTVSAENAKKNITCNSLNLGYFDIGMIKQVPEQALQKILQEIPMQKLGNPDNIFNAIEFLRNSDYITGTSIDINGGLY